MLRGLLSRIPDRVFLLPELLGLLVLGSAPAAAQSGLPARGVYKNYDNRGVVYLRTDPLTGKEYVGQAKSSERYEARRGEHIRNGGVDYEFRELARPFRPELDMVEATYIRRYGLEKEGGS